MKQNKIAIVGLGYVGLPLAIEFGKYYTTIGYDISDEKVNKLNKKIDTSGQLKKDDFLKSKNLIFTSSQKKIKIADFIIVAVPTPVDKTNTPDLQHLIDASKIIAKNMKKNSIVIYESTVFPGATEEVCLPILKKHSKLQHITDFNIAYSPERINVGSDEKKLYEIIKIVSADNSKTLNKVSSLYKKIIKAGVYNAVSIKVAEAAKVIENTQRDLNIALMNELSIIFDKMQINTLDVLNAANTKWNFVPFKPGLVGGHCIGVDPYYLTYKAKMLGYHPEVILAGRKINDHMAEFITSQTIKMMIRSDISLKGCEINILGLTFKENCPDFRNSKVFHIIEEFKTYGCKLNIHDPLADEHELKNSHKIKLSKWEKLPKAKVIIIAVAHDYYKNMKIEKFKKIMKKNTILIDIKSIFKDVTFDHKIKKWNL